LERGETVRTIAASLAEGMGERVDVVERDVPDFVEVLKGQQLLSC
jgi:hypothetical protein